MKADDPILLFYDGHERRAEHEPHKWLVAETRRHARFVWNRVRKKQMRSGFYTWFFMLRHALERAGYSVKVNDFAAARRAPDHPIGLVGYPSILDKAEPLSNPRVLGPGLFDTPALKPDLLKDPRNRLYLSTCQWYTDMFTPFYGDRIRPWFGGFDVNQFEDVKHAEKQFDVLIYDKIYYQRDEIYTKTIGRFLEHLDANGLTYTIVRYGDYAYEDYLSALRRSRTMAFFAHSETQGMAYHECLAMNVPICAWDEGVWLNPLAKDLSDSPVACTSVPYFDERCGERFKMDDMLDVWNHFWTARDRYHPRDFIADKMTFERSAQHYLTAYEEAGQMG